MDAQRIARPRRGRVEGICDGDRVVHRLEQRRVFHLAYEARFRVQTLDALALHTRRRVESPRFQVVTCIDEREESFRRAIEEVAPDCETFGVAGFFGVAMYYRGAGDAHYVPLCPVVIRPQHYVEERVEPAGQETHQRTRCAPSTGASLAPVARELAFVRAGCVVDGGARRAGVDPAGRPRAFPRAHGTTPQTGRPDRAGSSRDSPAARTHGSCSGSDRGRCGLFDRGDGQDRRTRPPRHRTDDGFSRLVLFLGHGSHSMNNPHESAHDCGACGGAVGGPNGRAIAQILNDPKVRKLLAERGIAIPAETVFVGGLHNTCNEYVKFSDADRVPESHRALFERRPTRSRPLSIATPTSDAGGSSRPRSRFHSPALANTSTTGPRTSPRSGPSGATRRTRSVSSAGASGRAGCSSTAGRSSTPTTRRRTTPTRRSSLARSRPCSRSAAASTSSTTSRTSTPPATDAGRSCRTTSRRWSGSWTARRATCAPVCRGRWSRSTSRSGC